MRLAGSLRIAQITAMGANRDDDKSVGLESGIHTDFADTMAYGDYLQLGKILSAQRPLSESPDELLFIIIHQATELWMKLMFSEVTNATQAVRDDDLLPAYKMLARVSRVQAQIIQSWDILTTLTPADFLSFRDRLGTASGFQSWQNRQLEFALGDKNAANLAPFAHDPELTAGLEAVLRRPSIYDETLRLLARQGFELAPHCIERDFRRPYVADETVKSAWLMIYRDTERWWELYQLAEKLVDLEDWFQQWRFRHLTTVERIIGMRPGTGGSAGVGYLRKALTRRFFPELWALRTEL